MLRAFLLSVMAGLCPYVSELGVLNEGIIGNRLLNDSPMEAAGGRFGSVLGQAGLTRFERDVFAQSGVKYVVVGLGINDIAFPGSLTPATTNRTRFVTFAFCIASAFKTCSLGVLSSGNGCRRLFRICVLFGRTTGHRLAQDHRRHRISVSED